MNPSLSAAHGRNNDIAWPVMVLAHNEAKRVVACLDSIYEANPGQRFDIFVMANGCTDNTEEVVRQYATRHHGVSEPMRPRTTANGGFAPRTYHNAGEDWPAVRALIARLKQTLPVINYERNG